MNPNISTEIILSEPLPPELDMFALAYVEHGGNLKLAYWGVYGSEVRNPVAKASELMLDPRVVNRINQLQRVNESSVILSVDMHMAQLAEIRDLAKAQGSFKTALEAEVKRGLVAGHYTDKESTPPPPAFTRDNLSQLADRLTGLIRTRRMEPSNVQDAQIIESTGSLSGA